MDVIELSIHGDIFLILNDLTLQEIEAVENYMYQCFVTNKRDIGIDAFIDEMILYNNGHVEVKFNFRNELDEVIHLAAIRQREVERYAM